MVSRLSCLLALVTAFAFAVPIVVLPGPDGVALAQRSPRRKPPETKKVQAVREWAFKRLAAAQEALGAEDYPTAAAALQEMADSTRLNEHETALMHQTWAYYWSAKEDYKKSIESFEAALATGGLPTAVELSVRYNIGQLYIVTERYREGIRMLEEWLALTEQPTADVYILLANAWVQLDDYKTALPLAEKAVAMSANNPREGWLRLLLALDFQLERYPEAAEVLEDLASLWPKKTYWMQLSSVYGQLQQDAKSLTALEVAYLEGYLTDNRELVRLAQMYLYQEIPYKAAIVLQKGFEDEFVESNEKNWELLANSWIRAQELKRALPPLERAATLSKDGSLYMRIGQIHVEAEQWGEAARALDTAIEKGGLDNEGLANLLLGIAHYNKGNRSSARNAFNRAARFEKTKKSARQWLRHLEQDL